MAPNAEPADFWLLLSESFFAIKKTIALLTPVLSCYDYRTLFDLSSCTLKLLLVFSEDWIGSCFTWLHVSILGKRSTWAGPILESKGMRAIFQKKKGKIFENLGKDVQNLKTFWKRAASCVRPSHETARICPAEGTGERRKPWLFPCGTHFQNRFSEPIQNLHFVTVKSETLRPEYVSHYGRAWWYISWTRL